MRVIRRVRNQAAVGRPGWLIVPVVRSDGPANKGSWPESASANHVETCDVAERRIKVLTDD